MAAKSPLSALQLQHISFGFSHDKPILQDVSLSLEAGKIYALMGSNGAGKTTLFNIITGFLLPQNGEIFLNGEGGVKRNLIRLPPYRINRAGIGRTFQDLRIVTKLSIRENILLAIKGIPDDRWMRALLPPMLHRNSRKAFETLADTLVVQYFLGDLCKAPVGGFLMDSKSCSRWLVAWRMTRR